MKMDKIVCALNFITAMACLFASGINLYQGNITDTVAYFMVTILYLIVAVMKRQTYREKKRQQLIDNLIEKHES